MSEVDQRRTVLHAGAALGLALALRPARAAPRDELRNAVRAFALGQPVREGRVLLDVAPLVENGNAVSVSVSATSPMTAADHGVALALVNERNPQRDVAVFRLGPRAGRATVAARPGPALSDGDNGFAHSESVAITVT